MSDDPRDLIDDWYEMDRACKALALALADDHYIALSRRCASVSHETALRAFSDILAQRSDPDYGT